MINYVQSNGKLAMAREFLGERLQGLEQSDELQKLLISYDLLAETINLGNSCGTTLATLSSIAHDIHIEINRIESGNYRPQLDAVKLSRAAVNTLMECIQREMNSSEDIEIRRKRISDLFSRLENMVICFNMDVWNSIGERRNRT